MYPASAFAVFHLATRPHQTINPFVGLMRQGTGARHKEALMPRPTPPTANARHQPDAPRTGTSPTSPSAANQPSGEPTEYGPADFPGCEAFHLPASELDRYEGRLEFWEARTETAWRVREPTTIYHERPARRLSRLAERIESLRGSRIDSFGSADLARFDAAGNKVSIVQADEALYLHPRRSRVAGPAIDVDNDPLPDVVLEVDHTTDVRRRKLGIYEAWGFPEVWVLVPPESRMRTPGLDIHLLRDGRYRGAPESAAFPGWRGEEIYLALIEGPLSPRARPALVRVARAMGAREGTRPEDDPITRSIVRRAKERGRSEAFEATVLAVLRARGIKVTPAIAEDRGLFAALPGDALMAAAVTCRDEADFRRRLRTTAR